MSANAVLVLCVQVILAQSIYGQSLGIVGAIEEFGLPSSGFPYGPGSPALGPAPLGCGVPPYGATGYGLNTAPFNGGSFQVTSFSPVAPTGVSIYSENSIEGKLSIAGELPFLGAVTVEGALPTAGAGGINYGCGNGVVGIISEGIAPPVTTAGYPAGVGYGTAGINAGLPYGRPGFGPGGVSAAF